MAVITLEGRVLWYLFRVKVPIMGGKEEWWGLLRDKGKAGEEVNKQRTSMLGETKKKRAVFHGSSTFLYIYTYYMYIFH